MNLAVRVLGDYLQSIFQFYCHYPCRSVNICRLLSEKIFSKHPASILRTIRISQSRQRFHHYSPYSWIHFFPTCERTQLLTFWLFIVLGKGLALLWGKTALISFIIFSSLSFYGTNKSCLYSKE